MNETIQLLEDIATHAVRGKRQASAPFLSIRSYYSPKSDVVLTLAASQESFFDSRCEIFPVSIQLVAADDGGSTGGLTSQQLAADIEFIDQVSGRDYRNH